MRGFEIFLRSGNPIWPYHENDMMKFFSSVSASTGID